MDDLPQGAARPELLTARLRLRVCADELVPAVTDFYLRNRHHLAPWDPPTPPAFYTPEWQARRMRRGHEEFTAGQAFRYWVLLHDSTTRIIGTVHFSQVSRGAFHSAVLGYAIDRAHEGSGLMSEAVEAGIQEMFCPRVNLHRVQASWRPENVRSGALLARLQFVDQGLARDYLYIDGAWRDHRIAARTNPQFLVPQEW